MGNHVAIGCKDGSVYYTNGSSLKQIQWGHAEGEAWGLGISDDGKYFVTSADDNTIKTWDFKSRKCIAQGSISEYNKKAPAGGASSLTKQPDSKCARAIDINESNGNIAVGHNNGWVTIRRSKDDLDNIITTLKDSREWVEVVAYNEEDTRLAVGSHDDNIYIYDVKKKYRLIAKCEGHNSFIVSLDWSLDSSYIRSVDGAHELLFHFADTGEHDPHGVESAKDIAWFNKTTKISWDTQGLTPSSEDGTHINHVHFNKDESLLVSGDDWGLVNIWRAPALPGHKSYCLKGHSEHVVRTYFVKAQKGEPILTIGGYDKAVMMWTNKH